MSVEASTRTLETPGATIVYDVRGPLPPEDGRPPLLLIGQPMDAAGFATNGERVARREEVIDLLRLQPYRHAH